VTFARVGVVGVGLIGGSLALAARSAGSEVVGFDRDAATLERARARGAIDRGVSSLDDLTRGFDLLVIALPLPDTLAALRRLGSYAGPVIDVASVKVPVVAAAAALPQFVGTHPMAGSERGGIDAAERELFAGATWAIDEAAAAGTRRRITAFVRALGAQPLPIGAADHDRIVALTSHLPQTLAVALGVQLAHAADAEPRVRDLCGPGMRSMLRLAHSSPDLWEPILEANAGALAVQLRLLSATLGAAATALEDGDAAGVTGWFGDAARIAGALGPERRRRAR
jgi:prephenate dehydrogenase